MKNYKVCVVVAGNWGRNHIRTLDNLKSLGALRRILDDYTINLFLGMIE